MTDGLNAQFLENPKKFLNDYLVISAPEYNIKMTQMVANFVDLNTQGRVDFYIDNSYHGFTLDRDGVYLPIPVVCWRLTPGPVVADEHIPSNLLFYVPGHACYSRLDRDSKMMVTENLSGCTFISSRGPTSRPLVMHAAGSLSDEVIEDNRQTVFGRRLVKRFNDDHIRIDSDIINIFGVHKSKWNWSFYAQGYDELRTHADALIAAGYSEEVAEGRRAGAYFTKLFIRRVACQSI
jgi:hypothetical protein